MGLSDIFSRRLQFLDCAARSAVTLLLLILAISQATAQETVHFVGVSLDPETRRADEKLTRFLQTKTHLTFHNDSLEYGVAVRQLADWQRGNEPYVARVTPYVYVAAEMLGANLKVLGTYHSVATKGGTTYHSYFVVNRANFPSMQEPGIEDLLRYLRNFPPSTGAHFIYHDKFSTSSFFLPALFFHSERIFVASEDSPNLTRIVSTKLGDSSAGLVEAVAAGQADLAAVWDGTKNKFLDTATGKKVAFIELPGIAIPNDLLICSAWLDKNSQDKIVAAVSSMKGDTANQINIGDFQWWEDIADVPEAHEALNDLRRRAAVHPAPVTVNVQASGNSGINPDYLEAARQAVRLSGTELVLVDSGDFRHTDVTWTLEPIHDGAVVLNSRIEDSEHLAPQRFQISFTDSADLTKRIGVLIHTRMHRIRYVWPYQEKFPIVIRNVDFSIPVETSLQVRKITWLDPERNDFREGDLFYAKVANADFFKFQLDKATGFPTVPSGTELDFDPMSNVAYRVVLVRLSPERPLFFALTVAFVGLLALAAVGFVIDVRRKPTVVPELKYPIEGFFRRAYQSRVHSYHKLWATREVVDASILYCDRSFVEEFINELKVKGLPVDWTTTKRQSASILASLPLLKNVVGAKWQREVIQELSVDPSKVGDSERLNTLISILVKHDLLAPFVGRVLEFDCLNEVVYQVFQSLSQSTGISNRDNVLSWDNPMFVRFVSIHLREVLADGERRLCLFSQPWIVEENGDRYLLTSRGELPFGLPIAGDGVPVHRWTMESSFSRGQLRAITDLARGPTQAWVLGRISERSVGSRPQELCLRFRTMAILKGLDAE